ncbi:MAG: hypothetical protein PVH79_01095 [Candidatus Bathyarchaeota archaeon]|jgi:archaellum component FlaF (FlaF/FlaG flagellin family)
MSAILGTLIFVGILFSAFIPMYLTMKQADTLYERKMMELKSLDDERDREKLYVVVYPSSENSSEVNVNIDNKGDVQVKIIRVWVDDDDYNQSTAIQSMDQKTLGPFPVSLQNGSSYAFEVTTERGNVYSSATGRLYYSDGKWYTAELAISVYILNDKGQYYIDVQYQNSTTVEDWYSDGIVHNDIQKTFEMPEAGTYHVIMKKKVSGEYKELSASPATVEIMWPDGPPLVYVFADGEQTK